MTDLLDQVWTMLNRTLEVYRDSPRATEWLRRHAELLDGPLRIAVVGQQHSGKSTLVNALVGEQVAPLDPTGEVRAAAWYRAGATPRATVHTGPGEVEVPAERHDRRLSLDLREWRGRPVDRVVVDWPSRGLKGMTLIDAPPVSADDPSTVDQGADAVLYLAQHLQAADLRLLRTMHEHPIAMAHPVATLLVLSRADELGASQIDALFAAKQVARQHRRDLRTRALCQDVISVTGLLGYAGKTLRQHEFDALATVAFASRAALDGYLLSADRFVGTDFPLPLDAPSRRALLDRLGLFGLRLCTTLIRQGFDNLNDLCAQLVQRSGLTELRESIGRQFTDRAPVLKARSALLALSVVLRMEPRPPAVALAASLERILAGAHELRELRLLATLQAGYPALPAELSAEARRLVGGDGLTLPARLGLADDPTSTGLRYAIIGALRRWREQAENPILDLSARTAAGVVVRSCEDMLANLAAAAGGRE
jgi:dynamin family protein